MFRKALAALCIVALSFVAFAGTPSAHAKTSVSNVPAYFDCVVLPCDSNGVWNGNNHGGETDFTVSNPGFHTTGGAFFRDLIFTNGEAYVDIGIVKWASTSIGKVCDTSTFIQYFFEVFNVNGQLLKQACVNVPTSYTNTISDFKVGRYTSNGGGVFGEITQTDGSRQGFSNCANPCFVTGASQVYGNEKLDEDIVDHVTLHQVFGSQWIDTAFQNPNTDVVQYQDRDFGSRKDSNPPQFYWNIIPAVGNSGGQLYSCDYESGTTCQLGG